ncbi:MAG: heavy metal translocating P-type ATPase, partial [Candidatus Calescibacterium sp.]|nr:heavy metal translocating P-type ATPase [Candidatus Calescibacterium sp.]
VGDGINDSLVMNVVDVGVSFEYGSDITQNYASVNLKNIIHFKELINISDGVFKKLKFNLFWVFGYNVLLVPVAMGFFYSLGITVNPMLAAVAMILSDFSLLFFNLSNIKLSFGKG